MSYPFPKCDTCGEQAIDCIGGMAYYCKEHEQEAIDWINDHLFKDSV